MVCKMFLLSMPYIDIVMSKTYYYLPVYNPSSFAQNHFPRLSPFAPRTFHPQDVSPLVDSSQWMFRPLDALVIRRFAPKSIPSSLCYDKFQKIQLLSIQAYVDFLIGKYDTIMPSRIQVISSPKPFPVLDVSPHRTCRPRSYAPTF